jgi:hypothetical protein
MRLSFIPAQTVKVASATRADLAQFLVGGVHIVDSVGRVRLWKVNLSDFSNAGEVPFPNEAGKDDSVALEILPNGDVLISVSEAVPGGAGATAGISVYRVAGVFPAMPAPTGGTVDAVARAQIAQHEARLDRIAAGAAG